MRQLIPSRGTSLEGVSGKSRWLAAIAQPKRFEPRKALKLAIVGGLLTLATASLLTALYFIFIASDKFETETRFTVRASEMPNVGDEAAASTQSASTAIVQDTQIILSYLKSRAAIELLDKEIDLRRLYNNTDIDYFSRLASDAKVEKVFRYWDKMVDVSVQPANGIVTLSVRAFTPQDAVLIARTCISASEKMLNQLNRQVEADSVAASDAERARAQSELTESRAALEKVRNKESMIDAERSTNSQNQLIGNVRNQLLGLQQEYDTESKYIGKNTPQIRALQARIQAAKNEIAKLTAQQTSQNHDEPTTPLLSTSLSNLEATALETHVAETQYASALSRLENARLSSEAKAMYVEVFLPPAPSQKAKYPRRALYSVPLIIIALGAFLAAFMLQRIMRTA